MVSTFDGTNWHDTILAADLAVNGGTTLSLDCVSATFCAASGVYYDVNNVFRPFASTFDGLNWTSVELAQNLQLGVSPWRYGSVGAWSVSCTSASFCAVVGGVVGQPGGDTQPFASTFDGTSWSDGVIPPSYPGFLGYLVSVSCWAANACTAGGFSEETPPVVLRELAVTLSGSGWSAPEEVAPSQTNWFMNGGFGPMSVSCPSATWCGVLGMNLTNYDQAAPTFAEGAQGSWSNSSPLAGAPAGLAGRIWSQSSTIACSAVNVCRITGNSPVAGDPNTATQAYVGSLASGTWTMNKVAPPEATGASYAFGISCPTTQWCGTSGKYTDSSGKDHAFVSTIDGSTVTPFIVATDVNAGGLNQMGQLSCPTTTFCVTGGSAINAQGDVQDFVSVGFFGLTPTTTTSDPRPSLPATGASTGSTVLIGGFLMSTGALLVSARRMRAWRL